MNAFVVIFLFELFNFAFSQSTASINADNALCSCDLTANTCDLNCCCDTSCSNTLKLQFSTCNEPTIITNDRVCSYKIRTINTSTKQIYFTDGRSNSGLCIYTNNYEAANYYINKSIITNPQQLNSIVAPHQSSSNILSTTSATSSTNRTNVTTVTDQQYPTGFVLSGNVGYEIGKPLMFARLINQSALLLNSDNSNWWTLHGECSGGSNYREVVRMSINLLTGCSVSAKVFNCSKWMEVSRLAFNEPEDWTRLRVASFAKVNLTDLGDWVPFIVSFTGSTTSSGNQCNVNTAIHYEVLYAKTGREIFTHSRIVGIKVTRDIKSISSNSSPSIHFQTTVNFIDVSPVKEIAVKLSPFIGVRLPYDFFFPIYNP